jgi:hypothetical protein
MSSLVLHKRTTTNLSVVDYFPQIFLLYLMEQARLDEPVCLYGRACLLVHFSNCNLLFPMDFLLYLMEQARLDEPVCLSQTVTALCIKKEVSYEMVL